MVRAILLWVQIKLRDALTRCAHHLWTAVIQFLLSPLLLWRSFLASALSSALYAAALSHYHYMNFLGYSALPFLERTEVSRRRLPNSLHCVLLLALHVIVPS
jgi:hypothetical protein